MKRIRATAEIQALKTIIRKQNQEIINLNAENHQLTLENMELRKQLEESRAKEGKGALERFADEIADAVAGLGKMVSTMPPDDLKALVEANDCDEEETT